MNKAHDHHVHYKWHLFVILYFYIFYRASYVCVWCGFIPSAVWRFSDKFFSFGRYRRLYLKREKILHVRCRYGCLLNSLLPVWGFVSTPWDVLGHCQLLRVLGDVSTGGIRGPSAPRRVIGICFLHKGVGVWLAESLGQCLWQETPDAWGQPSKGLAPMPPRVINFH